MSGFSVSGKSTVKLPLKGLLALACTVGTFSLSMAGAQSLFAGIDAIVARSQGNATVLEFQADLPFEYQLQVLGRDEILLRLYHARLANALSAESGHIRLQAEGRSLTAQLRSPDMAAVQNDYQELVLSGKQLGEQKIQVLGGTEIPATSELPGQPVVSKPSRKLSHAKPEKPVVKFPDFLPEEPVAMMAVPTEAPVKPAQRIELENQQSTDTVATVTTPKANSARPAELSPKTGSAKAGGSSAKPGSGPQIAGVVDLPDRRVFQPVSVESAVTAQMSIPAVNRALVVPEPSPATSTETVELAPEPSYQVMIPLPRYHGGAPPIQAVTLDLNGKPVSLKSKPLSRTEYQIGEGPAEAYNTLFQTEPENARQKVSRLMAMALTQYRQSNWEGALTQISQARQLDSSNAALYAASAEVQRKLSRLDAACADYARAVQLAPGKYDLSYAQVLAQAERREEAVRLLETLFAKDKTQSDVAFMLGTLYEEMGRSAEALIYLKKADQLHPASADIQYNLGLAYELSGSPEEAELHYRKALTLNPSARDAAQGLARVRH